MIFFSHGRRVARQQLLETSSCYNKAWSPNFQFRPSNLFHSLRIIQASTDTARANHVHNGPQSRWDSNWHVHGNGNIVSRSCRHGHGWYGWSRWWKQERLQDLGELAASSRHTPQNTC